MRTIATLVTFLATTAALLFGPVGSAHAANPEGGAPAPAGDATIAASAGCVVGTSGTCTTTAVQAVNQTIILNISTNGIGWPCSYRVRDIVNQKVVREGTVYGPWRPVLTNVYSWYRLELRSCNIGAFGLIFN